MDIAAFKMSHSVDTDTTAALTDTTAALRAKKWSA